VAGLNKQYIVWQEIFDNGLKVLPNTVIDVWKGGWEAEMKRVTSAGLHAILSTCWYLNYISYGADWTKYYKCDPQNFSGMYRMQTKPCTQTVPRSLIFLLQYICVFLCFN
jgi:hexosaminidase